GFPRWRTLRRIHSQGTGQLARWRVSHDPCRSRLVSLGRVGRFPLQAGDRAFEYLCGVVPGRDLLQLPENPEVVHRIDLVALLRRILADDELTQRVLHVEHVLVLRLGELEQHVRHPKPWIYTL